MDAVRAIPVRAMDDDLSTTLETHTGLMLHVRTVKPVDEPLLSDFFRHVTPEDLRFRFLGGVREVSHERLLAMAQVDHVATEHFLAFAGSSGAIVVAAMVACNPSMTKAEMAISVRADDRHRVSAGRCCATQPAMHKVVASALWNRWKDGKTKRLSNGNRVSSPSPTPTIRRFSSSARIFAPPEPGCRAHSKNSWSPNRARALCAHARLPRLRPPRAR
jgi:hypothetical protein